MVLATAAIPLLSLDAIVLDTETTGLDPARARVVQIGAIALVAGRVVEAATFETLVDPGEPIPAAVVAVHGIDDAKVAGAPRFPEAHAALETFRATRLVIGHNIGFDMAVFARECRLAGLPFAPPPMLDTRLLGEIAFPRMAGYTLDKLAARLEVDLDGRHAALADARATATVFVALLPHLRARGVRTLAEAQAACKGMAQVLEGLASAGWVEAAGPQRGASIARIDSYPFVHRVRERMSATPFVLPSGTPVRAAVAAMSERKVSSVFVADDSSPLARDAGIVTERDVMRALATHDVAALDLRLDEIAHRPLITVGADDFVYRAIGRMDRRRIRHLAVEDEAGVIVGALSARDLLRLRASDALVLGDQVEAAGDGAALAAAFARMPAVAAGLLAEKVAPIEVAAVISHEIGAVTARAAALAEAAMARDGRGAPPVPYAVLVLGSAGRGESLLAPDQDNAVIYEDGDDAANDPWFARHAEIMAAILDEAGVPLCKGGVMAKNPAFRGSLATWRARVAGWISRTTPDDLLAVDIFFDFRAVHGDTALATALKSDATEAAARGQTLAKLLGEEVGRYQPPLNLFGGLKLEEGRVDLKKGGLFAAVAAARCLALRHGLPERSTPARLAAIRARGIGSDADLAKVAAAHALVVGALLEQQLIDIAAGRAPSNLVAPATLARVDRKALASAVGDLGVVPTLVRELLFR
jgi:DNA polymerase-3 subunit epsilon/CBS domain-containing protein